MRLPITPQISTKDGLSNKNARLTNCLKETKKSGDKAVIRPGLEDVYTTVGTGNGLVAFNNELVAVYDSTIVLGELETNEEWVIVADIGYANYTGMTYAEGTYIILSNLSAVGYSSDGITWSSGSGLVDGYYETIAYGLGLFVTVTTDTSSNGIAASSDDGITWTPRTISNHSWRKVMFGNGIFIATPNSGINCAISSNGTSWTDSTMPTAAFWYAGVWNGSVFCVLGYGKWATTTDGVNWSSGNMPETSAAYWSIATNGSRFVTVTLFGQIYYSDDGQTWTSSDYIGGENKCVLYALGYFWNFNVGDVYKSLDGVSWDVDAGVLDASATWFAAASNGTEIVIAPISAGTGMRLSVTSTGATLVLDTNARYDFAQSVI